jgi:hypothetical protein
MLQPTFSDNAQAWLELRMIRRSLNVHQQPRGDVPAASKLSTANLRQIAPADQPAANTFRSVNAFATAAHRLIKKKDPAVAGRARKFWERMPKRLTPYVRFSVLLQVRNIPL